MSDIAARYRRMKADFNFEIAKVATIAAVGAFTYGYDLNWWGAALAHPYFNQVFGEEAIETGGVVAHVLSANQESVGTAISSVGTLVRYIEATLRKIGGLIAPAIGKRFGYLASILLAAVTVIVGSLIQITSHTGGVYRYWQIVAGKLIVTLAVGLNSINLPIYLNGVAPPSLRGAMLNLYTTTVALSALVASGTIFAQQHVMDDRVFLVPFTTPAITIATIWLIPETPHWLMRTGRKNEAVKVLKRMRPRYTVADIEGEVDVITAILEQDKLSGKLGLVECFRGVHLQRTLTVIGIFCFFQAQGLGYILGYFALLMVQIGLPNVFEILVIIYALLLIFSLVSMLYQDAVGRRAALLLGSAGMAACMLGFAGIFTSHSAADPAAGSAGIALVMIWMVIFTATWYSLTWTIATELPAIHLRPISLAMANVGAGVVGVIVTFVSPYIQNPGHGNLGPKIGYICKAHPWVMLMIDGSMSLISMLFVYFLVPEMKGRSAVEIDWLYSQKIPIRKMQSAVVPIADLQEAAASAKHEDVKADIEQVELKTDTIPAALPRLPA